MMRYFRCPYAFWLLDTGRIDFSDTVDEFQLQLLQAGNDFQADVEAGAVRLDVPADQIPRVLEGEITLYNVPDFKNKDLKIHGRPDGIDAAEGALIPIEMKSRKDVQRTDELELAFYWKLLEPFRTRDPGEPRGYVILRRDGGSEQVEVRIPAHRFTEVDELIEEVRWARRHGVVPRICRCQVCSQVRREDVYRSTTDRKDLTLVFGIGRHYAAVLEAVGVTTWEELASCDTATVLASFRKQKYAVSAAMIEQWRRHAECWRSGEPLYFGMTPFADDSFIALDLEYGAYGSIWLVGVCIVRSDKREYLTLWADDSKAERRNLITLADVVADNPSLPVVTWSGESADIPQLRNSIKPLRLGRRLESLFARHVDLFCYAQRSLRLPIPSLGLKEVGAYWGIPRLSSISGGLEAQMLYGDYLRTEDVEHAARLRASLEDYNRDDVDALVAVAQRIRELSINGGEEHHAMTA
jgi:predicted RecB family nuclease